MSDKGVEGAIDISCAFDSARYGELPAWSWIAQHIRPDDYATLNHYRRKIMTGIGNCIPEPTEFSMDMANHIAYYHSPVLANAMLKTMSPVEQQIFTTNKTLFPYNIMTLQGEVLQKMYLPYIMDKIMALISVLGRDYMPDYTFFEERPGKDIRPWYQNRIYGFALERYSTLFILQNMNLFNGGYKRVALLEENQSI